MRSASSIIVLFGLFLVGCGTTGDVLIPGSGHQRRAVDYRAALSSARPEVLASTAADARKRMDSQDGVLYALEAGRLAYAAGDFRAAARDFQAATDRFDEERAAARISVSRNFFSAAALATNDLAIPYRSQSYERLMAYNYLALCFLALGEWDNAQIALTAGLAEQNYLRDQEDDLAAAAAQTAESRNIGWAATENALRDSRARLSTSGPALEPYQNVLTYYLAGLLFDARDEPDRAAITLGQAASLDSGNPFIDDARRSLRDDDRRTRARVVVISQDGLVEARSTIAVPFFWNGVILQVAMPIYEGRTAAPRGLDLTANGNRLGTTTAIARLDAQARKTLDAQYGAIFVRQILRLITKYQTQQQLARENPWAGLAAQVFNLLTDKADERSWLTLPATVQAGHFDLAPGTHRLGVAGLELPARELPPGSTTFLLLDRVGPQLTSHLITFDARGNPLHAPDSNVLTPSPL